MKAVAFVVLGALFVAGIAMPFGMPACPHTSLADYVGMTAMCAWIVASVALALGALSKGARVKP